MSTPLERAVRVLRAARSVSALTGAGISAESGVPTFRGKDGLWQNFRAEDLANPDAFARDPATVWEWYRWRRARMGDVKPNAGHEVLARFERRFPDFTLVTQNVDGLHALAGSTRIIELHGNIWRERCLGTPPHTLTRTPREAGSLAARDVPRCHCGQLLRPDIVWFGEALNPDHLQAAEQAARESDVFLVIGTSSVVYPAAALPAIAQRAGATIIEINPEETPLTEQADIVLRGGAGEILTALAG